MPEKPLLTTWTIGGALLGYLFRGAGGALAGFIIGYIFQPERRA